MKKIGIIGGLGPEATVDYYNQIINAFKNETEEFNYPEIIVYSVNMGEFLGMIKAKKHDDATDYLLERVKNLNSAGADFAAISANTPHLLFDRLKEQSPLPLISIVEATCIESVKKGYKNIGLFGTGFTMEASFYSEVFKKQNINIVMPDREDKELINYKLFSEIELGIFKDETRQVLINIIDKMFQEQHIDSLILGCTEFPLILKESSYAGIPMLNTTKIHVDAIVDYCLNGN